MSLQNKLIPVKIIWKDNIDWDQICYWAIIHFGTPGKRYTTTATIDYMKFNFRSKKDAVVFALRWA